MEHKSYHLIGIKGIGMSALAQLLQSEGHDVPGSDTEEVFITDDMLKRAGITVKSPFSASNIGSPDVVIASSAYGDENPEIREAKNRGLKIISYTEGVAEIFNRKEGIAIAGTHGKTTITSMAGWLLAEAELDPTVLVGSLVTHFGNSNFRAGEGKHFVLEACEFKRNFLKYKPQVAIIPTIDFDHPDCFKDLEDTKKAFSEFLGNLKKDGTVIYCLDEENVRHTIEQTTDNKQLTTKNYKLISYGLSEEADVSAFNIKEEEGKTTFDVEAFGEPVGDFKLLVPGLHNVKNALAVIALAHHLGIDYDVCRRVLAEYKGIKRRFETLGIKRNIRVMDDFGHHPTEIEVTLKGIRQFWPSARIWAVFQPYTYSRTTELLNDFSRCFYEADFVVLDEIYASAREKDTGQIKGEDLYELMRENHKNVFFVPGLEKIADFLKNHVKPGDVVITLSCGDIYKAGEMLLEKL